MNPVVIFLADEIFNKSCIQETNAFLTDYELKLLHYLIVLHLNSMLVSIIHCSNELYNLILRLILGIIFYSPITVIPNFRSYQRFRCISRFNIILNNMNQYIDKVYSVQT